MKKAIENHVALLCESYNKPRSETTDTVWVTALKESLEGKHKAKQVLYETVMAFITGKIERRDSSKMPSIEEFCKVLQVYIHKHRDTTAVIAIEHHVSESDKKEQIKTNKKFYKILVEKFQVDAKPINLIDKPQEVNTGDQTYIIEKDNKGRDYAHPVAN